MPLTYSSVKEQASNVSHHHKWSTNCFTFDLNLENNITTSYVSGKHMVGVFVSD